MDSCEEHAMLATGDALDTNNGYRGQFAPTKPL
jgi:hypothetical protein